MIQVSGEVIAKRVDLDKYYSLDVEQESGYYIRVSVTKKTFDSVNENDRIEIEVGVKARASTRGPFVVFYEPRE